jgi:hypothetical protein
MDQKVCTNVENKTVRQAHYSIHHQLVVMETYVEKHLDEIRPLMMGSAQRHV